MPEKYDAYTVMIERKKKNKQTGEYEILPPQPYRTVDGRCVEASDRAEDKPYSIVTWLNAEAEFIFIPAWGDNPPITVAPHTCVALYIDHKGGRFTGTASLTGVMGSDESAIENGETSAVGRALGIAAIGIIPGSGIASAEEMKKVAAAQAAAKKPATARPPAGGDDTGDTDDTTARAKQYILVAPLKKYPGATLGQVLEQDAHYLGWIANDFEAKTAEQVKVKAAAKHLFDKFVAK